VWNVTATVSTGLCPAVLDSRSESWMKSFLNLPSASTVATDAAARSTFILLADLSECTPTDVRTERTVYMPLSDCLWEVLASFAITSVVSKVTLQGEGCRFDSW